MFVLLLLFIFYTVNRYTPEGSEKKKLEEKLTNWVQYSIRAV